MQIEADDSALHCETACTSKEEYSLEGMFEKIVQNSKSFYKLQSRSESDLTNEEKFAFLQNLYKTNPMTFLLRYDDVLNRDDAQFFVNFGQLDDSVKFLVEKLVKRRNDPDSENKRARNRRYIQLERMLGDKSGDYFTDQEMRKRQPFLYDKLVGKFVDKKQFTANLHAKDGVGSRSATFSSLLLDMYDNQEISARKREQQMLERAQHLNLEECEMEDSAEESESENQVDSEERNVSRKLFLGEMMENFMNGEDEEFFDYNHLKEDQYTEKELLRIEEQDEQDRYFDED